MNKSECLDILEELQRFYDKRYNEEQLIQICKYFAGISKVRFRYLVSIIYSRCKYLPSLAEMVEIHKEIPYSELKLNDEVQSNKHSNCEYCGNKGFIIYKKKIKENTYEYVASCKCARGQNFSFDGASVKDDRAKSDYYIPKAEDLMILRPQKHYDIDTIERAKKYIAERLGNSIFKK